MDVRKRDIILVVIAIIVGLIVYDKYIRQPSLTKVDLKPFQAVEEIKNTNNHTPPDVVCDLKNAKEIQKNLKYMATWNIMDGVVIFKWGYIWDDLAPEERLKLIEAFANSDACIYGTSREIHFYRKGVLVGEADTLWGIRLK